MKKNNSEYPVREHGEKKITIFKVASATTSSGNKYFHLLHRQAKYAVGKGSVNTLGR